MAAHRGERSKRKSFDDQRSPKRNRLPIDNYKEDLVRAVKDNQFLVIVGETGSGKTTQLPQYLYDAGFTSRGQLIGVTQPRRIAAISVANRVAEETSTEVGGKHY